MANIFPKATNLIVIKAGDWPGRSWAAWLTLAVWYYFTPKYSRVGYQPVQPVYFQHDLHVGQLGLDCRYCHSYVEVSGHSNYPTTQTCMNCHSQHPEGQSAAPAGARQLGHAAQPIAVGQNSQRARLRLLQPLGPRESRRELRQLPRQGQRNERRLPEPVAKHGLVPQLPSQPAGICPAASPPTSRASNRPIYNLDWTPPAGHDPGRTGQKAGPRLENQSTDRLRGVPPMKRDSLALSSLVILSLSRTCGRISLRRHPELVEGSAHFRF